MLEPLMIIAVVIVAVLITIVTMISCYCLNSRGWFPKIWAVCAGCCFYSMILLLWAVLITGLMYYGSQLLLVFSR